MTVLQALKKARKLIEKEENWTRKVSARDARGKEVEAIANEAVCWCAYGALERVCTRKKGDVVAWAWSLIALWDSIPVKPRVGKLVLSAYNDRRTTTHADILALYDRAIAAEQAKRQRK